MNITYIRLITGCVIASIAHAIMTNEYPELAYEQSWDGHCFSIQDGFGARGTIAFYKNRCVGAIRNEESFLYNNDNIEEELMAKWPESVKTLARKDTLQYMLDEYEGIIQPLVSTMFWVDRYWHHIAKTECCNDDLELLEPLMLPRQKAIEYWIEYYEMDSKAILLFKDLIEMKENDITKSIYLNRKQIQLLPGDGIHLECITSFKELNIYLDEV